MTTNLATIFLQSFEKLIQEVKQQKLTFFVVGRSGWGKSSTVNSLVGQAVCPVDENEPVTMEVRSYDFEMNSIKCSIYDTPGLCDAPPEAGNDQRYIKMIQAQVNLPDSMWYVSRLDETRVTSDEKRAIQLISKAFGANMWEQALIIFTFADKVDKDEFLEKLQKRTEQIRQEIAKAIGKPEMADQIPSVAVTNKYKNTPDGKEWLSELFTEVVDRMSKKGTILLLSMLTESITERTKLDPRQKQVIRKKFVGSIFNTTAAGVSLGVVITTLMSAPVILGFAGGGIIGTLIGAWLSETKSESESN